MLNLHISGSCHQPPTGIDNTDVEIYCLIESLRHAYAISKLEMPECVDSFIYQTEKRLRAEGITDEYGDLIKEAA